MSLKKAAEQVRSAGRGKDTELVHFTKNEVGALKGLAKAAGGKLTRNPETGMLEAGFLDSMLPTLLGIGANFIVPGSGMIVGGLTGALQNKDDPLMGAALGAMGGYGGGQIAAGLQGAGAGAAQVAGQAGAQGAQQAAMEAAKQAATEQLVQNAAVDGAMGGAGVLTGAGAEQAFLNQAAANAGQTTMSQAAADATKDFLKKPFYEQLGQGAQAAFNDPSKFAQGMGGNLPAVKAAGLAAAPMLYDYMLPQQGGGMPEDEKGSTFDYDPGYTGGTMTGTDPSSERRYFNPTYTRRMAEGGEVQGKTASGMPAYNVNQDGTFSRRMEAAKGRGDSGGLFRGFSERNPGTFKGRFLDMVANSAMRSRDNGSMGMGRQRYAEGGEVQMAEGGFVIPADVVSMAGNGSSSAGLEAFGSLMGAMPIDGPGDGMSDDIPASIDGRAPARVARQEAYLPPETVARMGGARKLYDMVDRVRRMAHGKTEQQRPVDLRKALA